MHCPGGNATEPIWRVLATSDGISCWTPLKPQHSNPKLFGQSTLMFWLPYSSDTSHHPSQTPCLPWISHCHSKTDARFMQDAPKAVLKHNFIAYRSSSRPDCIFEIHQLWQSGFSRVYSNCYCNCWTWNHKKLVSHLIKINSNNIVNFQESTTILNACTKKSGNLLNAPLM